MPFNTALSGIRAASTDLTVTGNNIANASTIGFKRSRAEFGDVFATSVLGAGANAIGSGVQVEDVAQNFKQGNVAFTQNELDLAINGNGFFVLSDQGTPVYSRAGTFGLDDQGYVTNNVGARLQGFQADSTGNISGISDDILIQTSNLPPRQTTLVESVLTLDSTEPVLQSTGRRFTTLGNVIGVTQAGLRDATTTNLTSNTFTLPLANDFATTPMTFDIQLSGASSGKNGTVSINLDIGEGVPATINAFNDLRTLTGVINSQIFSPTLPQTAIDVVANAVDYGGGVYGIEFTALQEGEGSQIQINTPSANMNQIGLNPATTSVAGIPAVDNGYPQQSVDFVDPDGDIVTYTALAGATAARTASEMNAIQGISASATTTATLSNLNSANDNLTVTLNSVQLSGDSLQALEAEINSLTNSTLPGISAALDPSGGALVITSAVGDDIRVSITSTDPGDSITVRGDQAAPAQILQVPPVSAGNYDADNNSIVVGGSIELTLDEGYSMQNAVPDAVGIFQPFTSDPADPEFTDVTLNAFDPTDQGTYNSATSMNVYDSLGVSHIMTQYFVRQEYDPNDPTTSPNHWVMHVQIDGRNVGDPDTSLPPPANIEPTLASFNVFFNENGTLNELLTEDMLISNWVVLDQQGNPTGAMGPQNVLAGGSIVIPEPPTSSNFVIELAGTSQSGTDFSVDDTDQDGYASGRLSGLAIDENGVIFARYTNGEGQPLAQVALADFTNQQGLQPIGNTMWAESFASGPPNVGTPQSGALGAIQSGALEESNVDLSEELVRLIIAQRNFQASAKTIETADQVTQTIINLR
ncbi:Flagellar basal body protein FlgE [Teredinibacter turnerae T7901]|uniref:Flagellar hook protein FlgE n=1 Tax=Teredinibacter turnerae (strain ATCC 39867 / T7901) TaxID=377629 RepID=C5BRS0_TERTT|nr:flagellar hook-basal body complex protein [Teredinibacter turnerae]ACR12383.1 Flagellar basal body protein FlgE [Teredinibacter turnerae T7901]